ncbi:MAG: hypothetical protein HY909_25080 [Deltaproteobacteria bacterium]|nr:hypothetical protein [Deltaproteobacteria bacterium]
MQGWVVALRGSTAPADLAARFGPALTDAGRVALHGFESRDPATAARWALELARSQTFEAAALGTGHDDDPGLREAILGLGLAAAPGEFLLHPSTWAFLGEHFFTVRPKARQGWRLPLHCRALAPEAPLRAQARRLAEALPEHPPWVSPRAALEALDARIEPGTVTILRAAEGSGASRLVVELARLHGTEARFLPSETLADPTALDRFLRDPSLLTDTWLLVDPLDARAASVALLHQGMVFAERPLAALVLRVLEGAPLPGVQPRDEVTLEPLSPEDCEGVVRAVYGPGALPEVVSAVLQGCAPRPGALVEKARALVQLGEVLKDDDGTWRLRRRRLRLGPSEARGEITARRIAALDEGHRRPLEILQTLGGALDHTDALSLLEGLLGSTAELAALTRLGLVVRDAGRLAVPSRVAEALAPDPHLARRVGALQASGARANAAAAELSRQLGDPEASSRHGLLAARQALGVRDLACATRWYRRAQIDAVPSLSSELEALGRELVRMLGPLAVLSPLDDPPPLRVLDPARLERVALALETRGEGSGALRLRALAALARGEAEPALQLSQAPTSPRSALVGVLGLAQAGRPVEAVRAALATLARSLREQDPAAERATRAVLASIYLGLGWTDAADRLAP